MTKNIPQALTFNDVLLTPQRSSVKSRNDIDLSTNLTPKIKINFPVIATNMDTVTNVDMAIALSRFGALSFYPRFSTIENQVAQVKQVLDAGCLTIPSIGIKDGEVSRFQALFDIGVRVFLIDVAHGHLESVLNFASYLKKQFKGIEIIAGAIATSQAASDLIKAGADALRVGVGPGSICTTRIQTGSGMPQLTAIMEVFSIAQKFNTPVIADGGMKNSGDIVKALAAGASAVSTGYLLAGTAETPGNIIKINGLEYKAYNGSTSKTEKINQLKKDASGKHSDYVNYVEGVETLAEYKGPVAQVLSCLDKGIRSGLSYSGAFNIKQLHSKARFVQVTPSITFENTNRGLELVTNETPVSDRLCK